MSEPLVTSESEQPGSEVEPPLTTVRFEMQAAPAETAASEPEAAPEPEPPAEPQRPAARAEKSQEWPLAWLRLVEAEPEPEPEPPPPAEMEAAPVEPGVANAFSKAMAAALDEGPLSFVDDKMKLYASPEEALAAALEEPVFDKPGEAGPDEPAKPKPKPRAARARKPAPAVEAPSPPAEPAREPEASALFTPIYATRGAAARKPAPQTQTRAQPVRRPRPQAEPEAVVGAPGEGVLAMGVYMLYLAGFLFIPSVVGVVVAYRARQEAPEWLQSHYLFQIRTFWIGLTGAVVGAVLLFAPPLTLVGLLSLLVLVAWLEVRSAVGFIELAKLRAYPRPREWLF